MQHIKIPTLAECEQLEEDGPVNGLSTFIVDYIPLNDQHNFHRRLQAAFDHVYETRFEALEKSHAELLAAADLNAQRIRMIESSEWITSPDDGVLSKGQWRLHIRKPEGGQTTIYGKTLIELLDNAIANAQPVVKMLREGRG